MLKNAYLLAKIGADIAENEQHFAEILPKIGNYPTSLEAPSRARTMGAQRGVAAAGNHQVSPGKKALSQSAFLNE